MTRRRASVRRARWLLGASLATGGAVYAWLHITWLATGSTIAVCVLYGLLRLARHHRPHLRRPRRPRTVTPPTPRRSIEFEPHGKYHGYNGPRIWYVGVNVIGDSRDFLVRATEHVAKEKWWDDEITECLPVAWYPTRLAAMAAEAYDIHTLDPPRNKTHRNWMHSLEDCPTIARARAAGYTIPPPSIPRAAARADPLEPTP